MPELINRIADEGLAVCLNWAQAAPETGRHRDHFDYPTGVLPQTLIRQLDNHKPREAAGA